MFAQRFRFSSAAVVWLAVVGALLAMAADAAPRTSPSANAPALKIAARVRVPAPPGNVAVGEGAVWVTLPKTNSLVRIDPKSRRVVARIRLGAPTGLSSVATHIAIGHGAVWVTDPLAGKVVRVDPRRNRVSATLSLRLRQPDSGFGAQNPVSGVAVGYGAVWVVAENRVIRIDPRRNAITRSLGIRIDVRTDEIGTPAGLPWANLAVAVGEGAVWVQNGLGLLRIDPRTQRIVRFIRGAGGAPLVVAHGAVWGAGLEDIEKIDPRENKSLGILKLPVTQTTGFRGFDAGPRSLWLANAFSVLRIDPESHEVTGEVRVSRFKNIFDRGRPDYRELGGLAVTANAVWVADPSTNTVAVIDPRS